MIFQFQVLGLLLMFLLVIFYYMRWDESAKKERSFQYLLLGTYLSQLIYVCTYISLEIHPQGVFYSKLYMMCLLAVYAGIVYYIFSVWWKAKYQNHGKILVRQMKWLKYGLLGMNVVSAFFVFLSKVTIILNRISYQNHIFMVLVVVYMILGFVGLFLGRKEIPARSYFHLWVVYFIWLVSFILQGYFDNLAIVNSFLILMIWYLYLNLENLDAKHLESLRLERDYHAKQNMDKVAFLKNLSHEIRTPLHTIDGFSQMILDSGDMKEIQNDVKDIRMASRDLIDVINGMIDLSIIESGNLEIIPENYNVYDMLDEVVEIGQSKLREKEVSLEVEIPDDIPEVLYGDSERISQVILNLLKNSIKYTEQGKILFRVESVKSKTMCRLKIMVSDTGSGMKEEEVQKIFVEPSGESRKGLGLMISRYLMELMDGALELESTSQEGTTVILTLDQKIICEKQEGKDKEKREVKPFSASGKRVLVVDDNKLNLKVASRMLVPYELEVVEVNSGKECLEFLDKDHHFDLILMDDLMPEMSGTETLDILKKIQRVDGYYIPVVVVTANAVNGQREKYLEMGFEDYLSKPIEKRELDRILRKYLKGKK